MSVDNDCRIILSVFRLGTNEIKKECTECQRQSGKTICLGEEQAFLLNLLLNDNQQWDIQNQKLHILDQEFLRASLRCGERPDGIPILWNEELVSFDENKKLEENRKAEEAAVICYINSQLGRFRHWEEICEPILHVLAVNSQNKVVERNTLVHLCMNSRYGAILFRKVIMRVLSLLVANWSDDEKIGEIAEFFCNFLKELSNYEYRSELEENIKARSDCIYNRIRGSEIDMLCRAVRPQNREEHRRWVKGGDILQYFACIERKDPIYYASRLDLIQRIFDRKGKDAWRIPSNMTQLSNRLEKAKHTRKLREIIDSIDSQDEERRKEAIKQLSSMIDLCVVDWIDEEVASVHNWILAG